MRGPRSPRVTVRFSRRDAEAVTAALQMLVSGVGSIDVRQAAGVVRGLERFVGALEAADAKINNHRNMKEINDVSSR